MSHLRIPLTDAIIKEFEPPTDGQYVVRDATQNGFYLLVGKRKRTFMVHGDLNVPGHPSKSIKVSVGDASELTTTKARTIAKGYLSEMSQGRHPKPKEVRPAAAGPEDSDGQVITLRVAWERYKEAHLIRKRRGARTIAGYEDHVTRVFKDWLDTPLRELSDDADRVARRHDEITKESGPYGANGAMRTLRAIYNHAWNKNKKALPRDNPVDAVDWNPEERRNTAMGLKDLPGWFSEMAALDNPIRREFHLLTLLSGSRPTALKTARVEHLDLRRRVLHIPTPKGGGKRAFDIPLSRQMILSLVRAMRFGRFLHPFEAQTWLFPADSANGHMAESKEDREDLSKWGNDLRQTFRTLAAVAKISPVDAKLLMNHAIPGVNEGYITREKIVEDHLRAQQQAISDTILGAVRADSAKPGALRAWLGPRATHMAIERSRVEKLDKRAEQADRAAALAA